MNPKRILGFDSIEPIQAGARTKISVRPQLPFKGKRLYICRTLSGAFHIDDIRVGHCSQFVSADPIPATVFDGNDENKTLRTSLYRIYNMVNNARNSGEFNELIKEITNAVLNKNPAKTGLRLDFDTAQIQQDIILCVTNISVTSCRFRAALIGEEIREETTPGNHRYKCSCGNLYTKENKQNICPQCKTELSELLGHKTNPEKPDIMSINGGISKEWGQESAVFDAPKIKQIVCCQGDEDGDI